MTSDTRYAPTATTCRAGRRLLIITLTVTLGLYGCSSTCETLRADRDAHLEQQRRAWANGRPAIVAAAALHEDALSRVANRAVEVEKLQTSAAVPLAGGTSLALGLRWRGVEISVTGSCESCVRVVSKVEAVARLQSHGITIARRTASGTVSGRVPLRLSSTEGGSSTLWTDLSAMTVDEISLAIPGLPQSAAIGERMLAEAINQGLHTAGIQIPLVSWEPLGLGDDSLRLSARQLTLFPDDGVAWVGFRGPSPRAAAPLEPSSAGAGPGEMSVIVATAFMTRLVQAAQVDGHLPSRLDAGLEPDEDGVVYVAIDDVEVQGDSLRTDFSAWHLPAQGACYRAALSARATADVVAGGVADRGEAELRLDLDDIEVVETRGDDAPLRLALWLHSAFVDETLRAEASVLAGRNVKIGSGDVTIDVVDVHVGERELRVKMAPRAE